jgi:P pilus assembly chaperone PapD
MPQASISPILELGNGFVNLRSALFLRNCLKLFVKPDKMKDRSRLDSADRSS